MNTKNNQDLSPEQKEFVRETVRQPALFAEHMLGLHLWDREVEILNSIKSNLRTAVKACHGVGKTFTLAVATLWWLARYRDGIVLTTSPTQRQVITQLWNEIRLLVAHARVKFPEPHKTDLKFRGDDNFAFGFSTNQAENFQGYHGKHVLILADEAPGIESGIWDAIAGVMAGGVVHIVMAGNPTVPSGAFFDAFNSARCLWNCFTMDAFDTPNLKGVSLQELLAMDTISGGPLDDNLIPYLTTRRWVRDQYLAWWHGDEASSPSWMSRVRGEFPSQASNALFKLRWLERSKERHLKQPTVDSGGKLVAGIDVGGGAAETVVYLCELSGGKKILRYGAWRAADTLDLVARFLDPVIKRLTTVRVDAIGIGYNFGLYLRKKGFPIELVNVGLPCEAKPHWHENNPAERFTNQKARYYQNLADAFENDEIDGLADDATIGQLAGLLSEIDSRGRIKIESKEDAQKRGVPSPDRADALMLALGELPPSYEYRSGREIDPQLTKKAFVMPRNDGYAGDRCLAQDAFDDLPERVKQGITGHGFRRGYIW